MSGVKGFKVFNPDWTCRVLNMKLAKLMKKI